VTARTNSSGQGTCSSGLLNGESAKMNNDDCLQFFLLLLKSLQLIPSLESENFYLFFRLIQVGQQKNDKAASPDSWVRQ